jgi:hypothetical protein
MTRPVRIFDQALVATAALVLACACSSLDNCPEAQHAIEITTGKTSVDELRYESAPWDALDAFPAKTALWFKHDLGVTPFDPKVYLSFKAVGTNGKEGGSVAESAGNQALFDCIDARYIVVRNDTCERDFHIKVVSDGASKFDDKPEACGDFPE